jgi:cytochrome P450
MGRSLWDELDVEWAVTRRTDDGLEAAIGRVLDATRSRPDLARSLAARLPAELWGEVFGLTTPDERARLIGLAWRMQRGTGWEPNAQVDGRAALGEAATWFDELLAERRGSDGDDLVSVATRLGGDGVVTGADLAVTLLEADIETLHGGLANMWFQLLTRPEQLTIVRDDPRLMKFAWLETLRHSPPVLAAQRWARHEVERFGRLLPDGALLYCSAAAANRDPRAFTDPDSFDVARKDLCQREPRGQYRADGLPSGIAFGLGKPSIHPAEPKERPRSRYALTRDVAVAASRALLEAAPDLALADGAEPELRSLRLGEMHTCWHLPVTLG